VSGGEVAGGGAPGAPGAGSDADMADARPSAAEARRSAVEQVAGLFDYRAKVASAPGRLWVERYAPHQELYAGLIVARNDAVAAAVSGGGTLLDVGCGMGDLLVRLADRYRVLEGIDPSPEMVEQCRQNLEIRRLVPRARVRQGVAEALECEDASVDTVLMLDVYEHIRPARRGAALAEVVRVLKPGGELCLVTPSRARLRLWNVFDNLLCAPGRLRRGERARLWPFAAKGHPEHFVSRRELVRDLAAAGLDLVHFERVGFYPAPERPGFVEPWLRRLWRRPAGRRFARALFAAAARVRLLNQKLLVRCERPAGS